MGQRREHSGFLQEALGECRIGRQRRRHDLERDLAVERGLQGQVDTGHAANPDLAPDHVPRNVNRSHGSSPTLRGQL